MFSTFTLEVTLNRSGFSSMNVNKLATFCLSISFPRFPRPCSSIAPKAAFAAGSCARCSWKSLQCLEVGRGRAAPARQSSLTGTTAVTGGGLLSEGRHVSPEVAVGHGARGGLLNEGRHGALAVGHGTPRAGGRARGRHRDRRVAAGRHRELAITGEAAGRHREPEHARHRA